MQDFASFLLAQTTTNFAIEDLFKPNGLVFQLILAIAILVGGWVVAIVFASTTENLLKRTDVDNRLTSWLTGSNANNFPVEKWAGTLVFWIILLFTLVAFFQFLRLDAVASPLNGFLGQIALFLPKLGGALLLAGVAWILATVSKTIVHRYLRSAQVDSKVNAQVNSQVNTEVDSNVGTIPLSETLSSALYWFILLLFLPLVLNALGLVQALQPLQNLIDQILSALPKILKAVAIGGIGWLIAQAVKRIVTNLLATSGADRFLERYNLSQLSGQTTQTGYSLSQVVGNFIYVLILITTTISALDALEVSAISRPATAMLDRVLQFIPQVFVASAILIAAYFFGQFLKDIVSGILTGLGFNNILQWLGFSAIATNIPTEFDDDFEDIPVNISAPNSTTLPTQTPSQIVGIIVFIAVMLVAIATTTDVLKIDALTNIVFAILTVGGQILSGLVIFAIGLYLANLAFNLIASSGGRQARILGHAARISIVALITAMALKQMGIASNIVDLAFGLLTGAIAVAIAVAFGLGGKDIASQQLREWLNSFKEND